MTVHKEVGVMWIGGVEEARALAESRAEELLLDALEWMKYEYI